MKTSKIILKFSIVALLSLIVFTNCKKRQEFNNEDGQSSVDTRTAQGENENLKKLLEEKSEFEKELSRKRDDVNAVNTFIKQTSDYSTEVTQQKARLESIKLFGETEAELHSCPLCSQHIETEIPSIAAINKSLADLFPIIFGRNVEQTQDIRQVYRPVSDAKIATEKGIAAEQIRI